MLVSWFILKKLTRIISLSTSVFLKNTMIFMNIVQRTIIWPWYFHQVNLEKKSKSIFDKCCLYLFASPWFPPPLKPVCFKNYFIYGSFFKCKKVARFITRNQLEQHGMKWFYMTHMSIVRITNCISSQIWLLHFVVWNVITKVCHSSMF